MEYSNPLLLRLRAFGQWLGVLRPVVRLARRMRGYQYEDKFQSELIKHIRPGQIIWDVGANVGIYVEVFSNLTGPNGKVVAFEPSPKNFEVLTKNFSDVRNVILENVALSDREGSARFFQSDEGVTDSLIPNDKIATDEVLVPVKKGDSYAERFPPDIIKMDVEGHEVESLEGMRDILLSPRMQCLFLEVHFSILKGRGLIDAPSRIVKMLTEAGLSVRWTDPSHLLASRVSSNR